MNRLTTQCERAQPVVGLWFSQPRPPERSPIRVRLAPFARCRKADSSRTAGLGGAVKGSGATLGEWQFPRSPRFPPSQLSALAALGEELTAGVGDVLYRVGDPIYPFIAIREGEVAILDAAGNEIVRHGASSFLGELNLLSGQTVFVTAVVTKPLRYIAVDRDALRALLFEDGPLSDLVLSTFIARREALQRVQGIGLEIVGPRSSEATMQMLDFVRANRLPFSWQDAPPAGRSGAAARSAPWWHRAATPIARRAAARAWGRPRAGAARGSRPARRGRRSRRPHRRGLRRLRRARHADRREHRAWAARRDRRGGSRTISASPPGISGTELTSRAVSQARKFGARPATPYRAIGLEPGNERHVVRLEEDHEIAARAVVLATGAAYRRLPLDESRGVRGRERVLRGRPARSAAVRRLACRCRRRRQLRRAGRRLARPRRSARDADPPPRRPGRNDVRLPHPRAGPLRRRRPRPQ